MIEDASHHLTHYGVFPPVVKSCAYIISSKGIKGKPEKSPPSSPYIYLARQGDAKLYNTASHVGATNRFDLVPALVPPRASRSDFDGLNLFNQR